MFVCIFCVFVAFASAWRQCDAELLELLIARWLDRARILSKASDGSPPQIDLLMDMQGFLHQEGLVGAEGQEDELGLELCEAPLADGIEGLGDAELAS